MCRKAVNQSINQSFATIASCGIMHHLYTLVDAGSYVVEIKNIMYITNIDEHVGIEIVF